MVNGIESAGSGNLYISAPSGRGDHDRTAVSASPSKCPSEKLSVPISDRPTEAPQAGEAAISVKISNLPSKPAEIDSSTLRIQRYRRQAEAGRLMPGRPVSWCCRKVAADPVTHRRIDQLQIKKSAASGHHYTGGHWACHSNPCPVCQASRAGVFLGRLLPALEANAARFAYGMDTLTASTTSAMTAGEFVPKFKRAINEFTSGGWWLRFRRRWHIRGWVTGQDFTQKAHGPHYHVHRLIVVDRAGFLVERPAIRALRADPILAAVWADWRDLWVAEHMNETVTAIMWAEASKRWRDCCAAAGLNADLDHGYHIEGGDHKVAHYIGKMALEVTQSGNKRGRGGWTLGELLDRSAAGDRQAGRFWREAVEALKGTAALRASKGLWALLESVEPTDAELDAGDQTEIDELIALLPVEDWYTILRDDRREDYFAALCHDDLKALEDFAELAGVRLLPPGAENTVAAATAGQTGMIDGQVMRIDFDALIGWVESSARGDHPYD